jgi:hypothetical protein
MNHINLVPIHQQYRYTTNKHKKKKKEQFVVCTICEASIQQNKWRYHTNKHIDNNNNYNDKKSESNETNMKVMKDSISCDECRVDHV